MTTSYLPTVLDDIRAGLAARPGLSEVNVFSGAIGIEEAGLECIAYGDARLEESAAAMGSVRQELWTVGGEIRIQGTWTGDTESSIAAVRDRTFEVFAEIESYLNDTYVGSLPDVEIEAGEMFNDVIDGGRVCRMTFDFQVMALKTP